MTFDHWDLETSFRPRDWAADFLVYRHRASGMRFLWARTDDPESFGAFGFPTYPEDSTGVAHILEHTVLCGSRRFPGTATFFQLSRSSLSSFLNAMTYPTATVYPFGSPHPGDLWNLFEVYADAVFFPLLREASFLQEGWHFQRLDHGWDVSGVVYNEMRGDLFALENFLQELATRALWTQGPLSVNSGGDPLDIPHLSWKALVDFHTRWYHPSNALFYLYGDLDPAPYLAHLETLLDRFGPGSAAPPLTPQPRRSNPSVLEATYPAATETDRHALLLAWLAEGEAGGWQEAAVDVALSLLMGEGGVIKHAVLESGLATDTDTLTDRIRQEPEGAVQLGFLGVDGARLGELERFVFERLADVAQRGFPDELVEAELRIRSYRIREVQKHQGLRILHRLAKFLPRVELWPRLLSRLDALEEVQRRAGEPRFWGDLVQDTFLTNGHAVILRGEPDLGYPEAYERRRREGIDALVQSLPDIESEARRHERLLVALRELPTEVGLPLLRVEDLPRSVLRWPLEPREGFDAPVQTHVTETQGIAYVDLLWDLPLTPPREAFALGLTAEFLSLLDLDGEPYREHVRRQKRLLGTFRSRVLFRRGPDRSPRSFFHVRFSFLSADAPQALDLAAALLHQTAWESRPRLAECLREWEAQAKGMLGYHGSQFSSSRAAALLSPLALLEDCAAGLALVDALLRGRFDAQGELGAWLRRTWEWVRQSPATVLWTADHQTLAVVGALWPAFAERVGLRGGSAATRAFPDPMWIPDEAARERYLYPLDGAFNALAVPFEPGEERIAPLDLFDAHLGQTELHRLHREQGGAYGVLLTSLPLEGVSVFSTYRDPRVGASLADFRMAVESLARTPPSREELDKTLMGVIGGVIAPVPPKDRGFHTFIREAVGFDLTVRQRQRDRLFSTEPRDLQRIAQELLDNWGRATAVSLAGKEIWDRDPLDGARDVVLDPLWAP